MGIFLTSMEDGCLQLDTELDTEALYTLQTTLEDDTTDSSKITSLELKNLDIVSLSTKFLESLPNLDTLSIKNCENFVGFQNIIKLDSLLKLEIVDCKNFVGFHGKTQPWFSLKECSIIGSPEFMNFEIQTWHALEKLTLARISIKEFTNLQPWHSLQILLISDCYKFENFKTIQYWYNLRNLEMRWCTNFKGFSAIQPWENLIDLSISNCYKGSFTHFSVMQPWKKIEYLAFIQCESFELDTTQYVSSPLLKEIMLDGRYIKINRSPRTYQDFIR